MSELRERAEKVLASEFLPDEETVMALAEGVLELERQLRSEREIAEAKEWEAQDQRQRAERAEAVLREIDTALVFHAEHWHDGQRDRRLVSEINSALGRGTNGPSKRP